MKPQTTQRPASLVFCRTVTIAFVYRVVGNGEPPKVAGLRCERPALRGRVVCTNGTECTYLHALPDGTEVEKKITIITACGSTYFLVKAVNLNCGCSPTLCEGQEACACRTPIKLGYLQPRSLEYFCGFHHPCKRNETPIAMQIFSPRKMQIWLLVLNCAVSKTLQTFSPRTFQIQPCARFCRINPFSKKT
ncbi:hypothetical protein ElyMa_004608200 [Elysia marginata]|uniref:C3H1-type domain-containing protein n=1 Tax=Elysia marginata TaxID=1093978 RepID=A0AAV4HYI4_9GAST|nr:hypothetical protein ElyMa_004608200 [Elysia marginata]